MASTADLTRDERPLVGEPPAPRERAQRAALAALPRVVSAALTIAAGLAAAVPVISATVKAARAGWLPGADQAIIATRAHDVFTSHTPLVGQYSLAGEVTGQVTHSLGPLLFWLLALPARFGSPVSLSWTMGAVNTLAIVGVVALARRRGGLVLMFATALAVALMCQSLATETLHDVWNPSAGLFPFTLLIFVCWSLACGDYRLLPLAALLASFVVQAHLMYLPPTLGLLLVGVGGLVLALRSRRRAPERAEAAGGGNRPPEPETAARAPSRRALAAWAAAALVVLVCCWSAPVIEELRERHGNITLVVNSATSRRTTVGSTVGWHAVVRAVGWRPWWLYVPHERWDRKYDVRGTPSPRTTDSALALLALLGLVLVLALARRRRDLAAAALIGFVLCGALAAEAASTPTPRLLSATLGYTMWWGSQVGMWVWLVLAWAAWLGAGALLRMLDTRHPEVREAIARRLRRDARAPAASAPASASAASGSSRAQRRLGPAALAAMALACLAAIGGTAAVGAAVTAKAQPDEHQALYRPTARLAARLTSVIPRGSTVELLGTAGLPTLPIKPALRYFLVRHDVRPLAPGSFLRLGDWYELRERPYRYVIYVIEGVHRPAAGVRLLDRVHIRDGFGHHTVSLWYGPHVAGGGARKASGRSVAPARAGKHR